MRIDISLDFCIPFTEHQQHRFIYIIINQYNMLSGRVDQIDGELVCIEYLAIIEYAL